jgi:2-dehydro-3-deoxyphosphogluconate aldolase/(4S)-4-hydroxy-2-oxoglutarate aldolase
MTPGYRFEVCSAVQASRLVAIVRTGDAASALRRGRLLLDGGVDVLEVSMTTPGALDVVAELAAGYGDRAVVGAGTVLDEATVRLAALNGARFVVAPTFVPDVVRAAHRCGLAAFPGAGTAGEALAALECGADAVKLFPAAPIGPAGLAAIREALPQVPFVPTGGVDPADAPRWLAAGALAVGLGSGLARLAEQAPSELAGFLASLRAAG